MFGPRRLIFALPMLLLGLSPGSAEARGGGRGGRRIRVGGRRGFFNAFRSRQRPMRV